MERKEVSFELGRRLKALRQEHDLSHVALAKQLEEKYGISISRDSLMSYEISEETHSKAAKLPNMGMRVEYLYCLADFYGVSLDYLLGVSPIRVVDPEVRSIHEYTGLSEEAIRFISGINNIPNIGNSLLFELNRLLCAEDFPDIIVMLGRLRILLRNLKDPFVDISDEYIEMQCHVENAREEISNFADGRYVIVPINDYIEAERYELLKCFEKIIDEAISS